jgi:Rrf2 family nitric oxide-sensitive transcriptional repressor
MHLAQFTDYSLRALLYLNENHGRLSTVSEIAQWYGVSKPHMAKVVHNLVKLGYIKSTQGKGGGICLNKPANTINIGKLIRETEPNFHIAECFDRKNNTCRVHNNCKLKHVLHEATEKFLNVVDAYTLETISLTN